MVLLTTTPLILQTVRSLPSHAISSLNLRSGDLPTSTTDPISHDTLIALSRHKLPSVSNTSTNENGITNGNSLPNNPNVTLNALLRGTRLYIPPPPPPPPKSTEYVTLMARLRAEQERKDYLSLLSASAQPPDSAVADQQAEDEDSDDISPSLILNILLSIAMCAAATMYLTRWWGNDGIRVLVSLGVAVIVAVAEVGVYAAYLRKVKESRLRERKKKERKVVLGEYKDGSEEVVDARGEPVDMAGEVETKEEIWGRGARGGVRRRVREKWEREQSARDGKIEEKTKKML